MVEYYFARPTPHTDSQWWQSLGVTGHIILIDDAAGLFVVIRAGDAEFPPVARDFNRI
jgi:hypothetical protein